MWQPVSNSYKLRLVSHIAAFAAGIVACLLLTGAVSDFLRRDAGPADKPIWARLTKRISKAEWSTVSLFDVSVPDLSPKLAARISEDYGEPIVSATDPAVGTIDPETGRARLGLLGEFGGGAYRWGFDEIVVHRPGEPVAVIRKARPEPRVLLSPGARLGLWVSDCLVGPEGLCGSDAGAFARWDAVRLRGGRYLEAEVRAGTLAGKPLVSVSAALSIEWDRLAAKLSKKSRPEE